MAENTSMKEALTDILSNVLRCKQDKDGTYCFAIYADYADYRDMMPPETAIKNPYIPDAY